MIGGQATAAARTEPVAVGEAATPCAPRSGGGETVSAEDFWGRTVVLAFYPGGWTPVCGDRLAEPNDRLPDFDAHGAARLGISVDSADSHAAHADARGLRFPPLADFEPKGAVARADDVYRLPAGIATRAPFVVDGDGVVRRRRVGDPWVNPGLADLLAALAALALRPSS